MLNETFSVIFKHREVGKLYSCISKAMMIIIVRLSPLWLVTPSSIFIGGHNPINNRVQRKQYLLHSTSCVKDSR